MLAKRVFRNIVYNTSSTLIANVTGLIVTIYLARVLKPELFGIYSLSISIAFLLLTFTDLGINATAVRYIAEAYGRKDYELVRGYIRGLSKLKIVLALLVSLILFSTSNVLAVQVFHKPELSLLLKIVSIFVFLFSISGFVGSIFNGFNDFKANLVRAVSFHVPRLILIVILVSLGYSVVGAIFGYVLAGFISLIVLTIHLVKDYGKFLFGKAKRIEWWRIVRFASYLTIGSISWVVFSYVDTVMIGMFLPSEYVGFYRAAYNIVAAISALVSIPAVLFPVFVQLEGKDLKIAFNRAFKYASVMSIPIVFGLIALSRELVIVVYGKEYLPAVGVLTILSFLILRASLGFWGMVFNAKEKPEYPVYTIFMAMILNIALNYFMILRFGIIGAALSTLISNALSWIVMALLSKRFFGIFFEWDHLVKPMLAGFVVFLILKSLKFESLLIGVIYVAICVVVYFCILLVIRGVTIEDIRYLVRILS